MDSEAKLESNTSVPVNSTTFDLVRTPEVATLEFAPILGEQLALRYGTYGVWRSNVTFPANATNVWFQFRTGVGLPLEDVSYGNTTGSGHEDTFNNPPPSSAATLDPSLSSTLVLLVALYLFC